MIVGVGVPAVHSTSFVDGTAKYRTHMCVCVCTECDPAVGGQIAIRINMPPSWGYLAADATGEQSTMRAERAEA